MGNRKENLKKSLGISVYPWSSDDEDNGSPAGDILFRRAIEPDIHTDVMYPELRMPMSPHASGQGSVTRLERDQFWSMLNNSPSRITPSTNPRTVKPPRPTSHVRGFMLKSPSDEMCRPFSSVAMKRIFSLEKFSRSVDNYRHENVRSVTPMDLTASFGRFKRNNPSNAVLPIFGGARNIPGTLDSGSSAEEPQPSTSRTAQDIPDEARHVIDVNESDNAETSPVPVSLVLELPQGDAPKEEASNEQTSETGDNILAGTSATPSTTGQKRTVKRKRDVHGNYEPYTVKEFNQSLLRLLECPVCLDWMEPPMSQCRRGHLVCGCCRSRLTACPVCRTAFSSVRNRAMEGVAEMLRYPCRHGCGLEVRLRRRATHEASCSSRRYRCPAPPCAERQPLPLHELHTHLKTKHPALVKSGNLHKFSMKMNCKQQDTWLVLAAQELFHLRIDVDIRTWGVVVYVAYIGPKCNAGNFTYEVTVVGQHNQRRLVYSRVTHSDLESSSLNVSRQDCFHLTLDQALNFLRVKNKHCEPDKFLDFYVEISRRKAGEPSKEESDT
ncbi:E3 ubiquitin-protein ligase siah-1-like isoform X2 [Battus philenor]|uniref:E3 ubiquitin-protein ligase siah-1-like isoform X2 n=1 Tax=Battus philenor TaxID=42288 RepID=UPI0035CEF52F